MENRFYLFGGIDDSDRQNDIFQYYNGVWSQLKVNGTPPYARSGAKCIQHHHNIYFFGGYTLKHGEYFCDFYRFWVVNNTW
jgi:hypothetical protein